MDAESQRGQFWRAVSLVSTSFFAVSCLSGVAIGQVSNSPTPSTATPTAQAVQAPSPTQPQSEIQELRAELAAQKAAQDAIQTYIEIIAGVLILVSIAAFGIQIWGMFADHRIRRSSQDATAKHSQREDQLHEKFLKVLDIATDAAKDTQQKVATLEEGGIKRAGETLQLINNLLTITERAAAKATGAQFEFLTKTIGGLNEACSILINDATKEEDRDIIAKPGYSEQVRILTSQIDAIDNQVTTYNESVPSQFRDTQGVARPGGDAEYAPRLQWSRLELTGPCLFIRGQNHLQRQNFSAAISDWKLALTAKGSESIRVEANYWIGYVSNTLGRFEDAPAFLKAASAVAAEQKKPELDRLELESRFFAVNLEPVPADLVTEGANYYADFRTHRVPRRTMSSFATTMGNITFIQYIRSKIDPSTPFEAPADSSAWFQKALAIEPRSRWARFGLCQNAILEGRPLGAEELENVRDVMGSVNKEYQNRVEVRSKVLSKTTEYICTLMLGDNASTQERDRLVGIAHAVEAHASDVTARTVYSQFRKQNVPKDIFLDEFRHLQATKDLRDTIRMANTKRPGAGL